MRTITPTEIKPVTDGERPVSSQEERMELEDSGCWAVLEEDNIRVYGKDGNLLFGVNPKVIPYEKRPLVVLLQIWLMGYNQGRSGGEQAIKTKVTEILKIVLS